MDYITIGLILIPSILLSYLILSVKSLKSKILDESFEFFKSKLLIEVQKPESKDMLNQAMDVLYDEAAARVEADLRSDEMQEQLGGVVNRLGDVVMGKVKGSFMGQMSGVNRQLKGAEKMIIAKGVDEATGYPIGDMVAGAVQKYPFIGQLLSQIGKGGGNQDLNKVESTIPDIWKVKSDG